MNDLASRIPFDDRINQQATINDLDLGLIREYLNEVDSDLFEESAKMEFIQLCQSMHIVKGSMENLFPVNVGLLFFCKEPEKFFSRAWIELVLHTNNSGREFKEYYFKGPIHKQLRDVLSFIKVNVIGEKVVKHSNRAEADRFYNFPYNAIEEILANEQSTHVLAVLPVHENYSSQESSEKTSQKGSQKSSQKIIESILSKPNITTKELAEVIGISRRAIAKQMANLKEQGIIERIGPDKGGFWKISD